MRYTLNIIVRTDWLGTTHFVTHMNFNKESPNCHVQIGVKLKTDAPIIIYHIVIISVLNNNNNNN